MSDYQKITDPLLTQGVLQEFSSLPDDYLYPEYGYFIVIESLNELSYSSELFDLICQYTPQPLVECFECKFFEKISLSLALTQIGTLFFEKVL